MLRFQIDQSCNHQQGDLPPDATFDFLTDEAIVSIASQHTNYLA